jgi:methionine synthase II (cobalamin-independent)
VHQALKFLPPDCVPLNPDCGLATGSGAVVNLDEARRKLTNEADFARILCAEQG